MCRGRAPRAAATRSSTPAGSARHYRLLLRNGYVTPDRVTQTCAVESCDRRAVTRGWCHGHYLRWSRRGDVEPARPLTAPVKGTCAVPGCDRVSHTATYCRAHYHRVRKYGDPLAGRPLRLITGDGSISHGYWNVSVSPDRAHLVPSGRTKELEHQLVMAAILGRPLRADETVHHKNGDRLDNRPENLELWSTAQPKGQRVADKMTDLDPESGAPIGYDERSA